MQVVCGTFAIRNDKFNSTKPLNDMYPTPLLVNKVMKYYKPEYFVNRLS